MKNTIRVVLGALLLGLSGPAAAAPTLEELLNATDEVARGTSSHAVMQMQVKTKRYERTMEMEAWSQGEDKSLIKITAPAKEAGTTTLMVGDNIWNYLPKIDRTMKLPAGMMSGAWMGSHFTNDDLVRASQYEDDYTSQLVSGPDLEGKPQTEHYVIESVPKPDAPVVWGKVRITIRADKVPLKIEYFEESGELSRTMSFADFQDVSGRTTPMTMRLEPADGSGEFTQITYASLKLDVDLDDSLFTLQSLK